MHYGIDPNGAPSPYDDVVPRLLCVGRLIPIKGHIVLLRAFAEARRTLPDLRLDIAGRGPLEPALRRLARRLTGDRDLQDGLVQEARICLWDLDPTRFDLLNTQDLRYVCRALRNRMYRGWKAELVRGVG